LLKQYSFSVPNSLLFIPRGLLDDYQFEQTKVCHYKICEISAYFIGTVTTELQKVARIQAKRPAIISFS
jgi:hypothetical protein